MMPSLTAYRYAFNNPVNLTDPTGLLEENPNKPDFTYSDGYSTLSSRNATGSIGFEGMYNATGGGDGDKKKGIDKTPQAKPADKKVNEPGKVEPIPVVRHRWDIDPATLSDNDLIRKIQIALHQFGFFPGIGAVGGAASKGAVYVVESIAGFYIRGNSSVAGGTYTRTIQALASLEEGTRIPRLLSIFEAEARAAGANKIIINGIDIVETRLMNPEAAQKLGYTYQQTSNNSIQLIKNLKKP